MPNPNGLSSSEESVLNSTNDERFIAIEIGGTKLQLVAGTSTGAILARRRFQVDRARGAEGIREVIAAEIPQLCESYQPRAIGVGYGGPVHWRTGQIAKSYHVAGWSDFPIGAWLHEKSRLPVFVENDANAAALGEAIYGAGAGSDPVLWMNAGSGVGGGLVVNGLIYHGAPPGEMELGHLRLDRDGTITEDLCSGWSVDNQVRETARRNPDGRLAFHLSESGLTAGEARILKPALADGDPDAELILKRTADSLAYALSHAIHLLHPETIVLGGGLAMLGEPLRARVEAAVAGWVMDVFIPPPSIRLAALMEDAVLVGALTLAAQRFKKLHEKPTFLDN
jgi:glucokinase